MDLAARWPLVGADGLRDALLTAYADESRGYHDLRHLSEVLERLDELSANGVGFEPLPVRLAAWFHDAVYDARPGAEERSARWAREALPGIVDEAVVAEVERLVLLTAGHEPGEGDANGAALCDSDLAILAAPHGRYATYAADVRREYAHLTDREFDQGRSEVLQGLGSRRALFMTAHAREHWEPRARANVADELSDLAGRA